MCTVITFFATYDLKNFKIIPARQKKVKTKEQKITQEQKELF